MWRPRTPFQTREKLNRSSRHNCLLLCNEAIVVAKLKKDDSRWYRVLNYDGANQVATLAESDITTKTVQFSDIKFVEEGCEKCEPTGTHTEGWRKPENAPNVLSPAERLTHCCNFNFCPVCGREL